VCRIAYVWTPALTSSTGSLSIRGKFFAYSRPKFGWQRRKQPAFQAENCWRSISLGNFSLLGA